MCLIHRLANWRDTKDHYFQYGTVPVVCFSIFILFVIVVVAFFRLFCHFWNTFVKSIRFNIDIKFILSHLCVELNFMHSLSLRYKWYVPLKIIFQRANGLASIAYTHTHSECVYDVHSSISNGSMRCVSLLLQSLYYTNGSATRWFVLIQRRQSMKFLCRSLFQYRFSVLSFRNSMKLIFLVVSSSHCSPNDIWVWLDHFLKNIYIKYHRLVCEHGPYAERDTRKRRRKKNNWNKIKCCLNHERVRWL